jgi:hypothetical protein
MKAAYQMAQEAMAGLKSSVYLLLQESPEGLTNAAIGRSLGIYAGHAGHEGHISRTILALMEAEGVVEQNAATKAWTLRPQATAPREERD